MEKKCHLHTTESHNNNFTLESLLYFIKRPVALYTRIVRLNMIIAIQVQFLMGKALIEAIWN